MSQKYTRCPHCRSIYALSVTQLTITQGLVNCPHCDHNFNALRNLYFLTGASVNIAPEHPQNTEQTNLQSGFLAERTQPADKPQNPVLLPPDLNMVSPIRSPILTGEQTTSPFSPLADNDAENYVVKNIVNEVLSKNKSSTPPMAQHATQKLEQHFSQQPAQLGVFYAKTQQSNLNLRTYLNHLSINQQTIPIKWQPLHQPDLMLSNQEPDRLWRYYVFWGCLNVLLLLILVIQIAWFNPKMLQTSQLFGHWFEQICHIRLCSP